MVIFRSQKNICTQELLNYFSTATYFAYFLHFYRAYIPITGSIVLNGNFSFFQK